MTKTLATLLTLVLNAFLSIKIAGEDIFAWKYEVDIIKDIFSSHFQGSHFFGGYYNALPFFGIISLVAQLLLLVSLFVRKKKNIIIKIAVLLLWLALFVILIKSGGNIFIFLLIKSSLFLIASIWLFWLANKEIN